MRRSGEPSPVFVAGTPRAGLGALAWSLGQHPAIATVLDASWMGPLSVALAGAYREAAREPERSQLVLAGTSETRFMASFGAALDAALGIPVRRNGAPAGESGPGEPAQPPRWVNGNPTHAFHMYGLSRVFPGARFIHVVRPLMPVVRSLAERAVPGGAYYTEDSAAETWLRHVRACLLGEAALGASVVLRVRYRELATDPERALLRCLAFLGEPFHPACLRPLRGLDPDPDEPGGGVPAASRDTPAWKDAWTQDRRLALDEGPPAQPDARALQTLDEELEARGLDQVAGAEDGSSASRITRFAASATPRGSTILVVSRGDEDLVRLPGRKGWHFPRTGDGTYAGHHPASSDEAVAHLEELRSQGARFLLLPCTSFWWLEHYNGLREHLEARYRLVAHHADLCLIFDLGGTGGRPSLRLLAEHVEIP